MSKLEEMARLGAKVFAACTLRSHLDVHIVQVQQNADNSATFRVTDTQNSIGAVQEAVPAPGTQQYRLTSLPEPSILHLCVMAIRFLMDPKTGRIVGSLPQSPGSAPPRATTPTRGRGRGRGTVQPAIRYFFVVMLHL